jgi:hypothetical protein
MFCPGGLTYAPFNNIDIYWLGLSDLWERTPSYAPTPGYLDREWTPSVICPSSDPENPVGRCSPSSHHPSDPQVFILRVTLQMRMHGMNNLHNVFTTRLSGGKIEQPSCGE